jgi:hypothetical protein
MRRAQSIFVVLALLALPVAPLAWGFSCELVSAHAFYCPMHAGHSSSGKPMICQCPGQSQPRTPDFTLVAPIPPATVAARIEMGAPQTARDDYSALSQTTVSGFRTAPFEPPRA